jgi:predicted HicB family RNase H-like nuclease
MGWHTSNSGRTSKNGRFVAEYSNKLGLKATVDELTEDFHGAVDGYLQLCEEKGIAPRITSGLCC